MPLKPSAWSQLAGNTRRLSPLIAGVLATVGLVGLRMAAPVPFERLQSFGFDTFQRLMPRAPADARVPGSGVVVVDIDEASLDQQGQWPWPRSRVAALVRNLQDAGAAAIGLDIVFAEPDRTSPAFLVPAWRRDHRLLVTPESGAGSLPDYDRELADALGRGRVVTGFGLLPGPNGKLPTLTNSIATIGGDPDATLSRFAGAVPNLKPLDEAAAGQGSFTIAGTGHDEIIRRLPLFMALAGTLVPALSIEVLRVATADGETIKLKAERNGGANGHRHWLSGPSRGAGHSARSGRQSLAASRPTPARDDDIGRDGPRSGIPGRGSSANRGAHGAGRHQRGRSCGSAPDAPDPVRARRRNPCRRYRADAGRYVPDPASLRRWCRNRARRGSRAGRSRAGHGIGRARRGDPRAARHGGLAGRRRLGVRASADCCSTRASRC